MSGDQPTDQQARRAIGEDLTRTLFVEAGAGTGKTTALVGRIVGLVRSSIPMAGIAAITFTDKAAAELRERLRRELAGACSGAAGEDVGAFERALEELDGAAVCTLHSFAQRILREHAVDAGLPPRLEVLDEIGAEMTFDDAWDRFVDELLVEGGMRRTLILADALGMRVESLRSIARRMADHWDLVAERIPPLDESEDVPAFTGEDLAADMTRLAAERRWCHSEQDRLALALADLEVAAGELSRAQEPRVVSTLLRVAEGPKPPGNRANWARDFDKADVQDRLRELRAEADLRLEALGAACAERLLGRLAKFTLAEAARRRAQGRLSFHDLLVLARDLLAHPRKGPAVRRRLRDRYRRLLIDEFQDTDPLQVELARLLVTDPEPGNVATGEGAGDELGEAGTEAGRLFFVGDPKQSLYRFRRADIGVYLREAERAGAGAHETLNTNWRSSPDIVDWVNATFSRLIRPETGIQPQYVPLVAGRERTGERAGAAVLLLGTGDLGTGENGSISARTLREIEFADVTALVTRAVAEGWPVDGSDGRRPLRLRDVCVLIPGRTALGPLVSSFEDAGVPYRVESSSLVYATRAETDLLAVLAAVDDPSDHLAVVTALRSAAFGFGDDDLYTYRRLCSGAVDPDGRRYNAWDYLSPQPDHPVSVALGWLADVHAARLWAPPGEIVDRVVRERRLMELAFAEDRHRDTWRRLRRAVDQARAFSDSTGGTLRAYLRWVDVQRGEGARVVEALVPEADDDAVRVMTVHAAKGLEFPFVVVAGFSGTTNPRRGPRSGGPRSGDLLFPADGGAVCRLSSRVKSVDFAVASTSEQVHGFHEDLRKLYVACTRARDYLAVSLYRAGRRPKSWEGLSEAGILKRMTLAELLAHTVAEVVSPQPSEDMQVPHSVSATWMADPEDAPVAASPLPSGALERAGLAGRHPAVETLPAAGISGSRAPPSPLAVALERAGWIAGRPVETLPVAAPDDAGLAPEAGAVSAQVDIPAPEQWRREHAALLVLANRHAVIPASGVLSMIEDGDRSAASGLTGQAGPDVVDPASGASGVLSMIDGGDRSAASGLTGRVAPESAGPASSRRDPELDKDEPSEDASVWGRGRGGTAFGRAVHAVLQTLAPDPGTIGGSLNAVARRCAAVEGVGHRTADVARRVRHALDSPAVREAARNPHWRELYAGAEIEGTMLEGFIDLLYERPDGSLVIVDYKTDSSDDPADLRRRRDRYTPQIAAYALMLEESTGRSVSRGVLLFLGPNGAHELEVEDLRHAIAEVRQALRGGPGDPDRRWEDIASALGRVPDTGHVWDDDPAAWVRRQRRRDPRRSG